MALNFQAFVDDSRSKDEMVLAGHIATTESWAQFSKEWEELLPFATRDKNGKLRFKMTEMASNPERMARVETFYRVVEKHIPVSISCRMNLADFTQAYERTRAFALRINWSVDFAKWENPYFFLFRGLMDRFHEQREAAMKFAIPLDEQVDFIFDNQSEKSFILAAWDEIVEGRPDEVRKYYGATPRFEDDLKFLPLQAADLWAWWVREWYEEDSAPLPDKMRALDFGKWRGKKQRAVIAISYTEDQIVDAIQGVIFASFPNTSFRAF
jgi:hypothetical protein